MFEKKDISGKNILITDDEPINTRILAKALEKIGHRTAAAYSGEECLEKAERSMPDLILLDIRMPFMSGIEVCKALKGGTRTKNIPVIFVTADTDDSTLKEAFESGGTDFVRKPVNMIELLARVNSVLLQQDLIKKHIEDEKLKGTLEMAGAVCHELNQPLQYILGASQLLLIELPKDDPRQEKVARIKQHIDRMGDITRKLMGITSFKRRDYVGGTMIFDIDKSSSKKTEK